MRILCALFVSLLAAAAPAEENFPGAVSAGDRQAIISESQRLHTKLAALAVPNPDLRADAALFEKGVEWALRYEQELAPKDVDLVKKSLARGLERAEALASGNALWTTKSGKLVRGFVSQIDGSLQPYGLIIPATYDGSKPMRLDVVLHGSSKPVGLSELRFGARFDDGDGEPKAASPAVDFIELHPLGRVENCYRWAGETDVFEAIEAVCRNYRIDRDRIVLRGMSMGASGTWHLGLKHPDRFVAIGPYCGYVDTHQFSESRPDFIRVGALPWYQERGLHMLDSVDYAANGGVVPAIAAIGDKDPFFQAHVIMGAAMAREGLKMVNLISPGTGHTIDPVTHAEQMRRIGEYAARGLDHEPRKLHFVTWTLKYNRCHWLELLTLGAHYERAEFSAQTAEDGALEIAAPRNITRFAIHPPMLQGPDAKVRIGGQTITLPADRAAGALVFEQGAHGWNYAGLRESIPLTGKRPGLQGPIDDAFASPFLCVRGTGQPWNPAAAAWAEASLRRFAYEWARYMRGDLPVKNDRDVTEEDIRTKHLVLFGDPGSNLWIARVLPRLPLQWTHERIQIAGESWPAADHAPALICASPLPGAGDHYLVLNSGHTFHESEFAAFNYLLFPRLGDWAVLRALPGADDWTPGAAHFPEEAVHAGFCDESWRPAAAPREASVQR